MFRKFLTAVLVVAAFGCARSAPTPKVAAVAPAKPSRTTQQALVAKRRELRPVGVAKELRPVEQHGVALHGPEKTYLEQVDNSGWSGRSPGLPPEAVGGGPPEYEDDADEEQQTGNK